MASPVGRLHEEIPKSALGKLAISGLQKSTFLSREGTGTVQSVKERVALVAALVSLGTAVLNYNQINKVHECLMTFASNGGGGGGAGVSPEAGVAEVVEVALEADPQL